MSLPERLGDLKLQTSKKSGFTLLELLVVISILSAVVVLLALLITNSLRSYNFNKRGIEMQDSAAKALRDFENKTRSAEQLVTTEDDELIFYAFIAGDQRPASSKIRYFVANGKLMREIYHPLGTGPTFTYPTEPDETAIIATGLTSSSLFTYYSGNNYNFNNDAATLLAPPVSISLVKMIRITVNIDYDITKPPSASHETTLINLRNLKRNL